MTTIIIKSPPPKSNKGADLPRGHHNWRHCSHPIPVIFWSILTPFSSVFIHFHGSRPFSPNFTHSHTIFIHFHTISYISIKFHQHVNPQGWSFHPREACPAGGSTLCPSLSLSLSCPTDLLQSFLVLNLFLLRWESPMGELMVWFGPRAHPPCFGLVGWHVEGVDADLNDLQKCDDFERWLLTPWPPCTPLWLPPSSLLSSLLLGPGVKVAIYLFVLISYPCHAIHPSCLCLYPQSPSF